MESDRAPPIPLDPTAIGVYYQYFELINNGTIDVASKAVAFAVRSDYYQLTNTGTIVATSTGDLEFAAMEGVGLYLTNSGTIKSDIAILSEGASNHIRNSGSISDRSIWGQKYTRTRSAEIDTWNHRRVDHF